jgi:hypothetical protein
MKGKRNIFEGLLKRVKMGRKALEILLFHEEK